MVPQGLWLWVWFLVTLGIIALLLACALIYALCVRGRLRQRLEDVEAQAATRQSQRGHPHRRTPRVPVTATPVNPGNGDHRPWSPGPVGVPRPSNPIAPFVPGEGTRQRSCAPVPDCELAASDSELDTAWSMSLALPHPRPIPGTNPRHPPVVVPQAATPSWGLWVRNTAGNPAGDSPTTAAYPEGLNYNPAMLFPPMMPTASSRPESNLQTAVEGGDGLEDRTELFLDFDGSSEAATATEASAPTLLDLLERLARDLQTHPGASTKFGIRKFLRLLATLSPSFMALGTSASPFRHIALDLEAAQRTLRAVCGANGFTQIQQLRPAALADEDVMHCFSLAVGCLVFLETLLLRLQDSGQTGGREALAKALAHLQIPPPFPVDCDLPYDTLYDAIGVSPPDIPTAGARFRAACGPVVALLREVLSP
jgi:hypothetical protein